MTFCKLLKITKELPGKNIDLKSSDLVSLIVEKIIVVIKIIY